MALKLIAKYSKRLGLPGSSSHQFSVCVETEIIHPDDIAGESARLYQTLQDSVDREIQHTGFVPDAGYGFSEQGARNGQPKGNGSNGHTNGEAWACSEFSAPGIDYCEFRAFDAKGKLIGQKQVEGY